MAIKRNLKTGQLVTSFVFVLMLGRSTIGYAAELSPMAVADLETYCRADMVQSTVAKLSPAVKVKALDMEPKLLGGTKFVAAVLDLPAYCQVTGTFVTNPKTGKTANFLATFPAIWNGKYLQMGCGGHCGHLLFNDPTKPTTPATNQGPPGQILAKGYATFGTDEGHEYSPRGGWAVKGSGQVDRDAVEDLYYRADKVLARLGKDFTTAFYTRALSKPQKITRSYFSGCSGGGRDALVAASYFPEEFDGIVAGSPYNLIAGDFHSVGVAIASIRSPTARIPVNLLRRIDPIVKAKCDALDGLKDDLVQNPAACDFRPDRDLPRCDDKTARTQCFTQAQIETISSVVNAVTDEDGNVVAPGFAVTELNPAFPPWPKDPAAPEPWPNALDEFQDVLWVVGNESLKIFVHDNDPNFHSRSVVDFRTNGPGPISSFHIVVPKAEVAKALAEARSGIGHFPENADKLIQLDRKLLIWHNLSDEKLSPYMSINYYKSLAKLHGGYEKLQKNVRLFGLPGTGHCSAYGVGPSNFDALTAIENWAEKGIAPDALLAKLYDPDSLHSDPSQISIRTMPLCKFPEMAHYAGHGNINDATNWSCPADDTSMLKVGESGRQGGVVE